MKKEFDIEFVLLKLKQKRQLFVSEADFQLELAWMIKKEYPNAKIRLEYSPSFDINMHIDILVIIDNEWIPIELKYKTKGCVKKVKDEVFYLKNHGAKDVNCYLYLKDIQRVEKIRANEKMFKEGYTIFITNDLSYIREPRKKECVYKYFSLEDGITKSGNLDWNNASAGTKKNCEKPINLNSKYSIKWHEYSKLDDTTTGTFMYLINKISN